MSRPGRTELAVYAICAVVVAVLGWRALHHAAPPAAQAGAAVPAATALPRASGAGGSAKAVVHVVGAVRRPGVYRLTTGARVQQAIERAGGATGAADLQGVNLAAKVADAQQVIVPRRAPAGPGGAGAAGV